MEASQQVAARSMYEKGSVVRGHHIYNVSWTPAIGKELPVERAEDNSHDEDTVVILHDVNGQALVQDLTSIAQLNHNTLASKQDQPLFEEIW